MAEMIADGMSYLESKSYIHRDLATVHKMLFNMKDFLFKYFSLQICIHFN